MKFGLFGGAKASRGGPAMYLPWTSRGPTAHPAAKGMRSLCGSACRRIHLLLANVRVLRRDRLGGLIREDSQVA